MGTSGAMSTSNTYVKYNISINQNWQSVQDNYSNVNVKVDFWRTNSGYQTYGTGTCYCKINGTTYSASVSSSQKITNSGITLFNRDVTVGHNADGSKYLDTSAWISIDAPLSSSEQWYGEWLSTIPRASQPSLNSSSVTMGNSVTVYTNRASSSFTHVLYYQIGSGGWKTIATGIDNSYSWSIPTSLANNIPNSTSLKLNMILETYSGNTYIGAKDVTLTANVPGGFVPVINSVTLSETVNGLDSKFGGYVQGKSKIKGVVAASGTYSSTISKYQVTTNSQTFTTSTFTTNEITNSGNQSVSTTVTDSRGRTASNTTSYTVIPYSNPTITDFAVARANSSGQIDDKGSYVLCTINASVAPVNSNNDKSFILKWAASGENPQTVDLTPTSGYTLNTTYLASNINVDKIYTFTLEVTDYFTTASQEKPIPTAFTLVDYNASGKSLAFGQVSTALASESKAQFKMDIDVDGNFKIKNKTIFDLIYPVGAIYLSVNSTDPSALFGGTWARFAKSRSLVGLDESNPDGWFKTPEWQGGSRDHRHPFRIGMHWWYGAACGEGAGNGTGAYRYSDGNYDGWARSLSSKSMNINTSYTTSSSTQTPAGQYSLGDTDLSINWPPCIAVYMWKRTA